MSATVREWQDRAKRAIPLYDEQCNRARQALNEHVALESRLQREGPSEFEGLLSELLPDLEAASLAQVRARTGALGGVDAAALQVARRSELQAELSEIQADLGLDLDGARERLIELEDELRLQRQVVRPLKTFVEQAAHERLEHLFENGYGTPSYEVPWYRLSYYSDWKAGDEILEATGEEFQEFGEFRGAYRERANHLEIEEPRLTRLEEESSQTTLSVARCEELLAGLESVPQWVMNELRGRLRADLTARGESAFVGRTTAQDPGGAAALRWVGVGKRLQYLRELRTARLLPFAQNVEKTRDKLLRKRIKYQRPKHAHTRFSPGEIEATFADRSAKWDKFWAQYEAAFAALRDFDGRYQYGRFDDDFLWWDMFCDGRVKGRFSEEVVEFYEEYDDYRWESPWDDEDDYAWEEGQAAAAAAEADGHDAGELWDGS